MSLNLAPLSQSDLQPAPITWLWRTYVAAGKLALLDGDPGCGKSLITIDLAARLSRGSKMPNGSAMAHPVPVLIFNAEDDPSDTIVPRLKAAGADLDRVFVPYGDALPRLLDDLPTLEIFIRERQIGLVIVDSLSSLLAANLANGQISSVRVALTPIAQLAARTGAAFLLIRHLTKRTQTKSLYRGLGSMGITGLARTVLLAQTSARDPSHHELSVIKTNLAAPPAPLNYRLCDRDNIPVVDWLDPVVATAEPLADTPERIETPGIVRATIWLLEALADGPKPAVELLLAAKAHGIRERTLEVAKRQLKIKSKVSRTLNGKRCWLWCPPTEPYVSVLPPLEIELEPLVDPNEDPLPDDLSDKAREMIDRERLAWAKRVLGGK